MAKNSNEFRFRPSGESRRGAALLIAMIALMLIMIMGGAFLRLGMSTKYESGSAMDQDEAFYICEAAIAESGAALTAGKSGSIAGPVLPARFGNGLFWVTATDLGNNDHQVDATAMCGSGRSALRAVIHVTPNPNISAGILGDRGVSIASNVIVDSFNSANGSYASQPKRIVHGTSVVDTLGNVRSNSTLGVSSNDNFFGNVTPGPGNSVSGMSNSTYVYGSTAAATTPVPLPPVVVPSIPSQGARSISKNGTVAQRTLAPGNYHYTSLTIENQAVCTIQGPSTVVLDSFTSNSGCSLLVDATGGPVTIYFTGTATFVSNMTVTSNSPTAKNISLEFSSSNPVSLASNASLLGTIYAPNAPVSVSSNWVVYGAITGQSINLAANVHFHYDEALNDAPGNDLPTVSISSWFERPMPVGAYARKRTDPFALMGIHQIDCPYPASAWD
jgi:hypothetical protein